MIGRIWRYAISDGVPRRSLLVALLVGTILNLFNQGDALLAGLPLDIAKLLLTYLVPYRSTETAFGYWWKSRQLCSARRASACVGPLSTLKNQSIRVRSAA